ncbi:MAG TPA: O-acetyl-ADP-ribose deacetylase [Halanaerobiales bacterium]|nr:O-acetyl-ADP-ribose deacetylase [Halanaerobiales bacterium]
MEKFKVNQTQVVLKQGDITEEACDGIVNAANSSLMGGGGVDGAIHRAGGPEILEECKEIRERQGKLPTGKAVVTTAGKIKAEGVIHTVGPIWNGGDSKEEELLANAYRNSLIVAEENSYQTVCFPSISTGAYGFPLARAAEIALNTIKDYIQNNDHFKQVRMILFSEEDYNIYLKIAKDIFK